MVVIGSDEADAQVEEREGSAHLRRPHGQRHLAGTPAQCIDKIRALQKHGCSLVIIEFFGRDSREPARCSPSR